MSLYYDVNMVSGVNFTPQLTLAEYNALSVKPTYWIRTDAPEDYGRLPASEVGYDNTTSGLTADDSQAAIDEVNDKVVILQNHGNRLKDSLKFSIHASERIIPFQNKIDFK